MRLLFLFLSVLLFSCSSSIENDTSNESIGNQNDQSKTFNPHDETISLKVFPPESVELVKQMIQQFIENKIPDEKYMVLDEKLYSSEVLPRAYTQKLFVPLWLEVQDDTLVKVKQMLHFLDDLKFHGLNREDYHYNSIKKLYSRIVNADVIDADIVDLAHLDLLLSDAFLLLSSHLYNGKYDPETLELQYGIQRGKPELELDHKLYKMLNHYELSEFMAIFYPKAHGYQNMVEKAKLIESKLNQDFQISLPKNYDFKTIHNDSVVLSKLFVKLDLLGYKRDSSNLESDSLALNTLVKKFQYYHGLNQDGELGSLTFEAINTPLKTRLNQLYINMERMRWLPQKNDEYRIVVNIADYTLDLIDAQDTILNMRTIVGRNFRKTPVFSSKMTYLVFSPTWTVPPGILRNDILPAVAKDINYLSKNNMIVLDRSGQTVSPSSIDWQKARTGSFPYTIRQQPGNNNALGRVKFMFPNRHSVYLHDTPSRSLFARDERLFSSGCIRIEKPFELAKILLNDSTNWGDEQIKSAMNQTKERTVLLKRPVNIYIYYLTAWDGDHFRKDVYGRDEMKEKLFVFD
jgi:murein L,D-transpeptidase YcbB/YkuD